MILVFGGGKSSSISVVASQYFGADERTIGKGGFCYSIPAYRDEKPLPLIELSKRISDFLLYASRNLDLRFFVYPFCVDAGEYDDNKVAPLFACASENVIIPGRWLNIIRYQEKLPSITRIILTGSNNFSDYGQMKSRMDFYLSKLNLANVEIISGGPAGADLLGARYSEESGLILNGFHFEVAVFASITGYEFCNKLLASYATHLVSFDDGASAVVKNLIDVSTKEHLKIAVIHF